MAEKKTLNTIIVLRNDQTTAWEESSYVMDKGELGIGYTADGKVIVKAGIGKDSNKTWKELPQVEGVFEDNLTLTYDFGKYKPDTSGSFTLMTAGKTMSEVLLDAYAQEVFEDIITGRPSASFGRASGISENNSGEVGTTHGSPAVKLDLTISGSYKYGAKNASGASVNPSITATSARILLGSDTVKTMDSANPNADLSYTHTLTGDSLKYREDASGKAITDTYTFKGYASHGADVNRPLTNLGNFISKDADGKYVGTKDFSKAIGFIPAKTAAQFMNGTSVSVKYTGFRQMFMGISDTDATVANGGLTSAFVRALNGTTTVKAEKVSKEFQVPANKKYFYVAIPKSLTTTAPDTYYKPFSNWESFSTVEYLGEVDVEGANSYTAATYKVYRGYSAAGKFEGATNIKVTVK